MRCSIICIEVLISSAAFAAILQERTASGVITSNFDNLPADPLLAQTAPIKDPYDGLKFNYLNARADGVSLLRSHSKNNTASSNTLEVELQGGPPANITTRYTGLATRSFDLLSTFIGCAVTSEASLGVPQSCDLLFTGIKKKPGAKPVSKTCKYRPSILSGGSTINAALAPCLFDSTFTQLDTVVVQVAKSLSVPTLTVLYLDDLAHKNYA